MTTLVIYTGTSAATLTPAAVSGNTFNLANEMTAFNGTAMTYDPNGNLLSDGTNTYTWDARNHLSTLTGSGTLPTSASFIYDPLGRRLERTINQQTTAFLYDGFNPVQELMPSGLGQFAPTATMMTGLGIDEFFQRSDVNGAQSFITDTLGSTLALANSSGTISTSYTYEPFGNVSISPSATNTNPYQFTGRENDGTRLAYFRARYYDAEGQRFIAQDPLALLTNLSLARWTRGVLVSAPSMNTYQYGNNSPLFFKDPLGLLDIPLINEPLPGYSFCGPGNNIAGATCSTDECCKLHDFCYQFNGFSSDDVLAGQPGVGAQPDQAECDRLLCDCIKGLDPASGLYDAAVRSGIKSQFCY